jgi:transposase InsO family protein
MIIKKGNLIICSSIIIDGLYIITHDSYVVNNFVLEPTHNTLSFKRKITSTYETYLWHLRLDHINSKRIQRLVNDGFLNPMDFQDYPVCESCLEGIELVHIDVCGPMSVPARGGYEYFITFTDDYSRYGYVYLMRRKSKAFERFKEFRAEAEKQLGKHIKALRSDRGDEYFLGDFIDHLSEEGILSQLTAPGTPQQNGVAERRNRNLLEMIRVMMSYATLPMSFRGYALETATHLLNLIPSNTISKIPSELWTGRRPSIRYIHIWVCPAHVLKGKVDKLESKTEVCLFVGYPKGTKGYLFNSPKEMKVFVTTNAKFLEEKYINNNIPKS